MARPATKTGLSAKGLAGWKADSGQADLQRHSLLSFFELSKELDYSLNIYDFADRALFNLMGHLGTSHSALWLRPSATAGDVVLVRSHGIPETAAKGMTETVGRLVSRFVRNRRIVFLADLETTLDAATLAQLRERGIALLASIAVPDGLLGIVALGHRIGNVPYERFELEVLQASIEFFAVALQNVMFSQQLQETNRQLLLANENLKELDRIKTDFVSNMQHELRTPVTVMQMYLESVFEDLPPEDGQREHLAIVMRHLEKLKKMIEALLDFSSLAGHGLAVESEPADIAAALRGYFDDRRNGVALQLRELRLSIEPELPFARFEKSRLLQILDIVLDNAVRYTPQGTRITLRAFRLDDERGKWVLVEMEDEGAGIPADELPILFVPFRQLHGSLTREYPGLGLGLALARQLAVAMGGRLEAASQVGKGTTLTLYLPAV